VDTIDTWTLGPSFIQSANASFTLGTTSKTPRIASLSASVVSGYPKARYYTQNKPQYAGAIMVQMKWFTYGKEPRIQELSGLLKKRILRGWCA